MKERHQTRHGTEAECCGSTMRPMRCSVACSRRPRLSSVFSSFSGLARLLLVCCGRGPDGRSASVCSACCAVLFCCGGCSSPVSSFGMRLKKSSRVTLPAACKPPLPHFAVDKMRQLFLDRTPVDPPMSLGHQSCLGAVLGRQSSVPAMTDTLQAVWKRINILRSGAHPCCLLPGRAPRSRWQTWGPPTASSASCSASP